MKGKDNKIEQTIKISLHTVIRKCGICLEWNAFLIQEKGQFLPSKTMN
jgi:hypothetical protein